MMTKKVNDDKSLKLQNWRQSLKRSSANLKQILKMKTTH